MANCPLCNCYVSDNAKFCPSCGAKMHPELTEDMNKNWYTGNSAPEPEPVPVEEYYDPGVTVREVYIRAADVIFSRPLRLWGMSLLYTLLIALTGLLAALPIIALPIAFALCVGMEAIYLEGLYGAEPASEQLFRGFKKGNFLRYAAGMGWMCLWVLIWSLIPIVGPIFGIIKSYAYRFVPYIMLSDPEVNAFDALKRSIEMTRGFRLKMFLADLLAGLCLVVLIIILTLLSAIPGLGILFAVVLMVVMVAAVAFLPLFFGLVRAAFYDGVERRL